MIEHNVIYPVALLAIFLMALWGIYSPKVRDGVIGRILYMAVAVTSLGGLLHSQTGALPERLITTLLVCSAFMMARELVRDAFWAPACCKWADIVNRAKRKVRNE